MSNSITLPVVFDDGRTQQVNITEDAGNKLHFALSIGMEPAGSLKFSADKRSWTHMGSLTIGEQSQIAGFIQNYTDDDWDH